MNGGKSLPTKILLFSIVTGILTGSAVTIYVLLSQTFTTIIFLGHDIQRGDNTLPVWYLYAVPILAILFVNWMIKSDSSVREYGVAEIAQSVNDGKFNITVKSVILKMIASSISLASGFNVGNEGPSAAIGAMIAYHLNRLFTLPAKFIQLVLSIGASSGIAAVFVSPITGITFALENIAYTLLNRMIGPIILGAIIAFAISYHFLVPLIFDYSIGKYFDYNYIKASLLFIPVMLISLYLYFALKKYILHFLNGLLMKYLGQKYRDVIFAVIGGTVIGTMLLYAPYAAFSGHEMVEDLINDRIDIPLVLIGAIILLRIVGTVVSIYSNAVGGLFLPLMSIGALVGYGFAEIAGQYMGLDIHSYAFAAIGASVFMGVVMRLPLTALVLSLEVTYDYNVITTTAITLVLTGHLADMRFHIKKLKAGEIER